MSYAFDRATYRIPYPTVARPRLYLESREFEVLDCSEQGLRYLCPEPVTLPEAGTSFTASVRLLHRFQMFEVTGTVLRCLGRHVCVEFEKPGLRMAAIFAEQRYLARRYPARFL